MGSQSGIGERLRAERVRCKRTLEDIARETRISPRMLEAIEREDFAALPGILFTRSFVRQYALAIGLDPEPMLAELPRADAAHSPLPEASSRMKAARVWDPSQFWDPAWNGAAISALWLLVAIVAAVAAYVHFNRPMETRAGGKAITPAVQTRQKSVATPAGASPAEPRRSLSDSAAPRAPIRRVAETPEAAEAHKVNVSITAHADTWIQVSADGKTVFTGTLKPNESREISGDETVQLLAGNAGGITVSLNGRMLDPLGTTGQVKVLRLTEGGPQAGLVTPNPPDDRL